MDIISHGLWPIIIGKIINLNSKLKINLKWVAFWGIFPDLLAFTFLTFWSIFNKRGLHPADHSASQSSTIFEITSVLYSFSHSLIVIAAIILVLWVVKSKFYYVLGGWVLHILMDIPTHAKEFYPTPFLWPLSQWTFGGIRWGQLWFIILNYSILCSLFLWFFRKEIHQKLKKLWSK
ncbi:hypothetical protein HQ489_06135 [Candidatus Woesearchaeota archaeon]|nr:hypothetical protein [Candidatus Woesearchaeota archaeon]